MVTPFIVVGSIALGAMVIASTIAIPVTIWNIIDKSGDKEDTSYLAVPPKASVEKGGFRVIIVNQAKSWNKAIRLYPDADVEEFTEVKCGDTKGKTASSNPAIKFDNKRLNFKEGKIAKLAIMKPGALGIWKTAGSILIDLQHRKQFNGRTIYIYFDDAGDNFFAGETNPNRLTVDKLM